MRKIKVVLEYDGTAYHGWQIQKGKITVQEVLEDRLRKVTGEDIRVTGASRTDAGVHALDQVAVFRTESRLDTGIIKKALNALLPQDIRILDAAEADDAFRPREDALKKSYCYVIANQRKSSVFLYRYSWLVIQSLDMHSMMKAAQALIGTHDFTSFMGSGSDIKDPVREVFSLSLDRLEAIDFMTASLRGNFITFRIEANGFLRHMVRNITGTLVEIGRGRMPADRILKILHSRDRRLAGPTAPPQGLFLERIYY